jgi:hypothetical protein
MSKNRLESQLLAYGAMAVAGTVGGVASSADAAIVYSGPVSISIPLTTAGVYLNVVTNLNGPAPAGVPGWDVNPYSASNLTFFNPSAPTGGVYTRMNTTTSGVSNMPAGTMIDGASLYTSGNAQTSGSNPFVFNSNQNLVGIRFQNEANGNAVHYGWMRISLGATLTDPSRAIVEYAYEDQAGVGIPAGAIPAPGSVALLALGAAGLAGRRRKA